VNDDGVVVSKDSLIHKNLKTILSRVACPQGRLSHYRLCDNPYYFLRSGVVCPHQIVASVRRRVVNRFGRVPRFIVTVPYVPW
jgi:hypothetical protein